MDELLEMLKALADRNRLRIMAALLQHEELCACQLTELLGVTGATASRHLAQLQHSGLLLSRKEGRWVFFRLNGNVPQNFPESWLKEHLLKSKDIVSDKKQLQAILAEDPEDICRRQRGEACCPSKKSGN